VRNANKNISRFVIAFPDENFQRFAQWDISCFITLDDFARQFIYNNNVVILIEDTFG